MGLVRMGARKISVYTHDGILKGLFKPNASLFYSAARTRNLGVKRRWHFTFTLLIK